jgi:hypothetical protein
MLYLASSAAAGEVHFDPQSPAGKEYALPLPQARSEALGTDAPADPPLFGVGIGDPSGGEGRAGGTSGGKAAATVRGEGRKHKGRSGAHAGGGGKAGGDTPSRGSGGEPSRPVVVPSASYDASGAIALLGGLILLAVLAGFVLRLSPGRRATGLR